MNHINKVDAARTLATRLLARTVDDKVGDLQKMVMDFKALDGGARVRCWSLICSHADHLDQIKWLHPHLAVSVIQALDFQALSLPK